MASSVQTKTPSNNQLWNVNVQQDENENYKLIKSNIDKVVKYCHNLLYDNGSIVGTKAQNDIMRLLCVHILKEQFADENASLWEACNDVKSDKNLSDTKFSKYKKYCQDPKELNKAPEFFKEWRFFVRDLLRDALPSVFYEEDERFNCGDYTVVMKMIEKMDTELPSSEQFRDAFSTSCGDIHEMFRAYGGGKAAKELGQFFTPRELIHLVFHGLNLPSLLNHDSDVSIYDPCMGTGGFLTRMHNLFDVLPSNIYGCETEVDTIKFGQMSMVLTTGEVCNHIVKCNSISENPFITSGKKFKAIVTNPPFGTKMKYKDLKDTFEKTFPDTPVKFKDVYPINTSNGACLFVQHCVYMLEEGGVCALVLPDGELFDSHSKWSAKFRKWWCENVNIRTILKVPSGVFKHAGVRTNVVVFTKDGPTTSIQYQDIPDKSCERINELFSVDMEDIVQTEYNLDHKAYLKEEGNVYDVPMVALGEVCTFEKGSLQSTKNVEGEYPFITAADEDKTHNTFQHDKECVLFVNGSDAPKTLGKVKYWSGGQFTASSLLLLLTRKQDDILHKYIALLLRTQKNTICFKYAKGSSKRTISRIDLASFKIPLPTLQTQHQIVQELETIETSIQTLRTRVNQLKREKELFHKYGRKAELMGLWEGCEWRKLGEVCTLEKGTQQSSKVVEDPIGEARMITLSKDPSAYKNISSYKIDGPSLFIGNIDSGKQFAIRYFEGKCDWINIVSRCNVDQSKVHPKFLYYFLCTQQEVLTQDYLKGSANLSLNKPKFLSFKIPLPTLSIQTQSIAIFEAKAKHIQTLDESIQHEEQHIKDLQQLGKDVIASFCSSTNL